MKYRMLTSEELIPLEEDLKHFLIVNGIEGDSWDRINRDEPEKAIELVGLFSDTVLQKVYEKITYLEHRSVKSCLIFKFGIEQIELISINAKAESTVDLSSTESIHNALINHPAALTYFRHSKNYQKTREQEVHELITSGSIPSSSIFWNLLIQAFETK